MSVLRGLQAVEHAAISHNIKWTINRGALMWMPLVYHPPKFHCRPSVSPPHGIGIPWCHLISLNVAPGYSISQSHQASIWHAAPLWIVQTRTPDLRWCPVVVGTRKSGGQILWLLCVVRWGLRGWDLLGHVPLMLVTLQMMSGSAKAPKSLYRWL